MAYKIFFFSANCEIQYFDDHQLQIIKTKIESEDPDAIVLALQEAKSHSDGGLSKRLFKVLNDGVDYHDKNSDYPDNLDWNRVKYHHNANLRKKLVGMTKKKLNYLQIAYLHKGNGLVPGGSEQTFTGAGGQKGKGGAGVYFNVNNKHYAFISCHLESKDGTYDANNDVYKAHNRKLEGVQNTLEDLENKSGVNIADFHAIFIMGDLNFRLLKDPAVAASDVDSIADRIIGNGAGLGGLWNLDSLNDNAHGGFLTAAPPNGYGFSFDQPNPLYYPTYKRDYEDAGALRDIAALAANVSHPNIAPINDDDKKRKIKNVYFHGKADTDIPSSSRDGYYELGWLDRIGYKCAPAANIGNISQFSFDELSLSDHVPIGMCCTIDI